MLTFELQNHQTHLSWQWHYGIAVKYVNCVSGDEHVAWPYLMRLMTFLHGLKLHQLHLSQCMELWLKLAKITPVVSTFICMLILYVTSIPLCIFFWRKLITYNNIYNSHQPQHPCLPLTRIKIRFFCDTWQPLCHSCEDPGRLNLSCIWRQGISIFMQNDSAQRMTQQHKTIEYKEWINHTS